MPLDTSSHAGKRLLVSYNLPVYEPKTRVTRLRLDGYGSHEADASKCGLWLWIAMFGT